MVLSTMVRSSCRMWHNFSFFAVVCDSRDDFVGVFFGDCTREFFLWLSMGES